MFSHDFQTTFTAPLSRETCLLLPGLGWFRKKFRSIKLVISVVFTFLDYFLFANRLNITCFVLSGDEVMAYWDIYIARGCLY